MPVVLLCHCDGANGSTTFTDVSPSAHPLTTSVATVSTAQVKFGTGSASIGGGYFRATTGLSDFDFQSAPFTIEAWGYLTGSGTVMSVIGTQTSFSDGWIFGGFFGNLSLWYTDPSGTTQSFSSTTALTTGAWHHYAADRDAGGTLRLYLDGAVVASRSAPAFKAVLNNLVVGNSNRASDSWQGYIDEARVTKGEAVYGGAFTPPTGPFGGAAAATQGPRVMVMA